MSQNGDPSQRMFDLRVPLAWDKFPRQAPVGTGRLSQFFGVSFIPVGAKWMCSPAVSQSTCTSQT